LITFFGFSTDQDKCKKCDRAIQRLEEVDDDADQHKIGFVKIQDKRLAFEYGLETMPALVYYRKKIPIVYDGEIPFLHDCLSLIYLLHLLLRRE